MKDIKIKKIFSPLNLKELLQKHNGKNLVSANWKFVKQSVISSGNFLSSHIHLLIYSFIFTFLLSCVLTLRNDGVEIFRDQRNALVLEVFSKTNLKPEYFLLLEEKLRSLDGVRKVVPTSPEEGLKRLSFDPGFEMESKWLNQKSSERIGKEALLPWSYALHLDRWDDPFLKRLIRTLQTLEVGTPKTIAVSEVHYDSERWALAFAMVNYLRWIHTLLLALGGVFAFFTVMVIRKWILLELDEKERFWKKRIWNVLWLGLLAGFLTHIIYVMTLTFSFYSGASSWSLYWGKLLPVQLFLAVTVTLVGYAYYSLELLSRLRILSQRTEAHRRK